MRILFANTIQMFGGGEIWMLRTLSGLRRRGHRVFLLSRPGVELQRRAQQMGIPCYAMRVRGDFGPLSILRAFRLLRRLRIDAVLTNMDKELRLIGTAARLAGPVVVLPRRGIDFPLKDRLHYRLSYTRLAHGVIANSNATAKALRRNAPWLDPGNIHVIYNGIDPVPFSRARPLPLRERLKLRPGARILGFAGQLDERKGLIPLVNAFALSAREQPRAHLVLAGTGPLRGEIVESARRLGIVERIHLLGFLPQIEPFMAALDALILPSLWEGFGLVLIEAMAAGIPAITTAVSSMPEIVLDGRTGRVVPPGDEKAMARAIVELLSDRGKAALWGQQGRERVLSHFTLDRMLDQLEQLFQEKCRALRG